MEADYAGSGGIWGPDNRITFARGGTLWQVPAAGGPAQQLTTLDSGKNERLHIHPTVVAGGKAILFTSVTAGERTATHIEACRSPPGSDTVWSMPEALPFTRRAAI